MFLFFVFVLYFGHGHYHIKRDKRTIHSIRLEFLPTLWTLNLKKKMYFFDLTGEFKFLEAENIDRVIGFL